MLLTKVLGRVARSPSAAGQGLGQMDIALHVPRCRQTRDARVQSAFDDVASYPYPSGPTTGGGVIRGGAVAAPGVGALGLAGVGAPLGAAGVAPSAPASSSSGASRAFAAEASGATVPAATAAPGISEFRNKLASGPGFGDFVSGHELPGRGVCENKDSNLQRSTTHLQDECSLQTRRLASWWPERPISMNLRSVVVFRPSHLI
jgi:hypothetical protein